MERPENLKLENAVIEGAEIIIDSRGILTAWIDLRYAVFNQNLGGYALHLPKYFTHYTPESPAGHFIYSFMKIAGVKAWKDLPGKTIRVKHNDSCIWEIGHIVDDDWFCPAKDLEAIAETEKK